MAIRAANPCAVARLEPQLVQAFVQPPLQRGVCLFAPFGSVDLHQKCVKARRLGIYVHAQDTRLGGFAQEEFRLVERGTEILPAPGVLGVFAFARERIAVEAIEEIASPVAGESPR